MVIRRVLRRFSLGALCIAVLLLPPAGTMAQDPETSEPTEEPTPESTAASDNSAENLLDLGFQRIETPVGDFVTTLLGYTRAFRGNMSFSASMTFNYVDSIRSTDQGIIRERHLGLGDTILIYSYVPGQKVTAQPWVPKSAGFSVLLVVPTGNAADLLGGDQWVFSPQAGWVVSFAEHFTLLQALHYTTTFAGGNLAVPVEELSGELVVVWAHESGWWIDYGGEIVRDLRRYDWRYDDTFSVGKMFGSRFGLSVAYGVLEGVDPTSIRDDNQWMLFFHYVMPGRSSR